MTHYLPQYEECQLIQKKHTTWKRQEVQAISTCQNKELPTLAENTDKGKPLIRTNGYDWELGDRLFIIQLLPSIMSYLNYDQRYVFIE